MALWTWWQGDILPALKQPAGFEADTDHDEEVIARLAALPRSEVAARIAAGHRAYLAHLDGVPVAYGWVATLDASIGELELAFDLESGDRYLWDFATLPDWRGRGIYPCLLQEILAKEGHEATRFWIINAPENTASGAGIAKAGFREVSELAFRRDGGVGTVAQTDVARARVGAALLGVPLLEAVREGRVISPCWRCVLAARHHAADEAACWPYQEGIAAECSCR